jgi:plastocyanin
MLARTLAVSTLCAAAAALLPAQPASALGLPQEIVTAAHDFWPADITIFQGDSLTLVNADTEVHDVSASDWINGHRMFQSAAIGPAKTAKVLGVESLSPSVYPFVCSLHADMVGTLTVLANPGE